MEDAVCVDLKGETHAVSGNRDSSASVVLPLRAYNTQEWLYVLHLTL
jgi:hypothetical protein